MRSVRLAVSLVLFLVPSYARGDAPRTAPVAIVVVREAGAQSCPDEHALRSGIAVRLGHDPFVASATRRIEVRMSGRDGALAATVTLIGEDGTLGGQRELTSDRNDDCAELADAIELSVSIAIDPLATLAPTEESEERAQRIDEAPAAPAAPTLVPQPAPPAPRTTSTAMSTSAPCLRRRSRRPSARDSVSRRSS